MAIPVALDLYNLILLAIHPHCCHFQLWLRPLLFSNLWTTLCSILLHVFHPSLLIWFPTRIGSVRVEIQACVVPDRELENLEELTQDAEEKERKKEGIARMALLKREGEARISR